MDQALAAVAEQLVFTHRNVPSDTVIRVLTECVDEFPDSDSHFIVQAATARLAPPPWPGGTPTRDALDVSLHDGDLQEEVDLTALLMVAANEWDHALPQSAVDEILGVVATQPPPTIVSQRSPFRCAGSRRVVRVT